MSQRKNRMGNNGTTAKERASVYSEKGTTESSAIQMLQGFFYLFFSPFFIIKESQKKTCLLQNDS
uniref:Uncharacterized protein n=1 Tax=Anguilla anguilla TaxID=7936 RepID=A0A0E9XRF2_ANGAN